MAYDVPKRDRDIKPEEVRELVGRDDPLIYDLGCNDAETSAEFLRVMPRAIIVCCECNPQPLKRFKLRDDPRVTLFECAVYHRNGRIKFFPSGGKIPGSNAPCADDWDYSGSTRRPTGHLIRDSRITFDREIEVEARTLDEIALPFRGRIDFIHADLQGGEASMILGGQQTLERTRYLYLEYYDRPLYDRQADLKGLISFLPDWKLLSIWGENALFENQLVKEEIGDE